MVFRDLRKWTSSPNLEQKEDSKTTVTFQEKKTLIREALGQRTEWDDFHFLDQQQQVVVMRLRMGHN